MDLEVVDVALAPCYSMCFEGTTLYTAKTKITAVDLVTLEVRTLEYKGTAPCKTIDALNGFVAVHTMNNSIHVLLDGAPFYDLPSFENWVTAVKLTANKTLTVAFDTNQILIWNLKKK